MKSWLHRGRSAVHALGFGTFRRAYGEMILRRRYRRVHGRPLGEADPRTFTAQLYARMLRVNDEGDALYTRLADKLAVREHVRERVGDDVLVPLLWSGEDPRDIPWDRLPERCIAKVNHGSGGHVLLTRDTDREAAVAKLARNLRQDFYRQSGEYHYHAIPRRVLIEEVLDDGRADGPLDYRIWCFHGRPTLLQVDNHPHSLTPFFDTDWTLLDLGLTFRPRGDTAIPRPASLGRMLEVAARLSDGHDFVRVDLYHVHGRVYFGEMTFTPTRGVLKFAPDAWDRLLGELWLGAPPPARLAPSPPGTGGAPRP